MSKAPPFSNKREQAQATAEMFNPGFERALEARYDAYVPGFARTVVDVAYGEFYTREGLDARTRILTTIAALTAMGAQTRPQLKTHIGNALHARIPRQEICETIFQMALYGGFPAMISAMNAAIEVFEEQKPAP